MANTNENINLITLLVDLNNPKNSIKSCLVSILRHDEDYRGVANEISDKVIKKNKPLNVINTPLIYKLIRDTINTKERGENDSQFLLANTTCCSGYDFEVTEINKTQAVVSIAYLT